MLSSVLAESATARGLMPGSSALGLTSEKLNWNGFSIVQYLGDRGERPDYVLEQHTIGLWKGSVATGERPDGRGGYVPYKRYPETVTLVPSGVIRRHYAHNAYEVVLCQLEPRFVNGIADELDRRPSGDFHLLPNVNDLVTAQLITLLAEEVRLEGSLGQLYAEHLAHAITIRMFTLGAIGEQNPFRTSHGLPRHLLRRVLDRMEDLNADLDLASLAMETGYSRGHFLRMFRSATGYTPHRYLLQRRLIRAQELIQKGSLNLIDIAAICGFSSHAHMARAFRLLLGMSPSQYRRNL